MKKNEKLTITEMTREDFEEIVNWEKQFSGKKEFESIQRYLDFETQDFIDYLSFLKQTPVTSAKPLTLSDIIEGYHFSEVERSDYDPIEERHLAFVSKNEKGEIVLFALIDFADLLSHHNPAYIDSIVVHPMHQNKGYATHFLTDLFSHQEKYFGWKPNEFQVTFNSHNPASIKLFEKFGFSITEKENFVDAKTYNPQLINQSQPEGN